MGKQRAVIIALVLISIILTSSFIIYELGFKRSSVPSGPFSGALWQRPIANFANDIAVNDGKVFTTDNSGNVNCFDSQNGESIWNGSLGGSSHKIEISENQVYVSFKHGQVGCFDEDTGTLLWTFQNPQALNSYFSDAPRIIVNDGRVFAITDTISAHNATTGELLWQAIPSTKNFDVPWSHGQLHTFPLSGDPFDSKCVYAIGGNFSGLYYYKIKTDNGSVIWRSNVTWNGTILTYGADFQLWLPSVLAISQEKVIVKIIFQEDYAVNLLLCLDSITGKELWTIDVGAKVYNPIIYNNLLLFAASNGYFYALNLADGTITWKTKVDTQNLFSLGVQSSSIQIDSKNQRLFWYYVIEQSGTSNNYTGTLCSLNLAGSNVKWMKQINSNRTVLGYYGSGVGLAINNDTDMIFLTENWGLWIFNASTGDLIQSQQFDHSVLAPIVLGNKTFVVGDLWLFAYA